MGCSRPYDSSGPVSALGGPCWIAMNGISKNCGGDTSAPGTVNRRVAGFDPRHIQAPGDQVCRRQPNVRGHRPTCYDFPHVFKPSLPVEVSLRAGGARGSGTTEREKGRGGETMGLCPSSCDEAHRFAVTFHRKRRQIRDRATELREIPGVGESTTRRLLEHFGQPAGSEAGGRVRAVRSRQPGRRRRPFSNTSGRP